MFDYNENDNRQIVPYQEYFPAGEDQMEIMPRHIGYRRDWLRDIIMYIHNLLRWISGLFLLMSLTIITFVILYCTWKVGLKIMELFDYLF